MVVTKTWSHPLLNDYFIATEIFFSSFDRDNWNSGLVDEVPYQLSTSKYWEHPVQEVEETLRGRNLAEGNIGDEHRYDQKNCRWTSQVIFDICKRKLLEKGNEELFWVVLVNNSRSFLWKPTTGTVPIFTKKTSLIFIYWPPWNGIKLIDAHRYSYLQNA